METVYIVQGSTGAWDTHTKIIIGVYSTKWKAEMARETAIHQDNLVKNQYTPEERARLSEELEKYENMYLKRSEYPENIRAYELWTLTEFLNEQIDIIECELDKPLMK